MLHTIISKVVMSPAGRFSCDIYLCPNCDFLSAVISWITSFPGFIVGVNCHSPTDRLQHYQNCKARCATSSYSLRHTAPNVSLITPQKEEIQQMLPVCIAGGYWGRARKHNALGAESLRGGAKSPINFTSAFPNTVHLLPKNLRFEHGRAKLVSCPGRHLTAVHPLCIGPLEVLKRRNAKSATGRK